MMDPKAELLKDRIRSTLDEYIREHHPGCKLGAFVLNIFATATDGTGTIVQETLGDGDDSSISALEAFVFAIQSMQSNVEQWRQPMRPG